MRWGACFADKENTLGIRSLSLAPPPHAPEPLHLPCLAHQPQHVFYTLENKIFTDEKAGEKRSLSGRVERETHVHQWQLLAGLIGRTSSNRGSLAPGLPIRRRWASSGHLIGCLGEGGGPDQKGLPQSKASHHSCLWGSWSLGASLVVSLGKGGGPVRGSPGQQSPWRPLSSCLLTAGGTSDGSPPPRQRPTVGRRGKEEWGTASGGGIQSPFVWHRPPGSSQGDSGTGPAVPELFLGCEEGSVGKRACPPLLSAPPPELLPVTHETQSKMPEIKGGHVV